MDPLHDGVAAPNELPLCAHCAIRHSTSSGFRPPFMLSTPIRRCVVRKIKPLALPLFFPLFSVAQLASHPFFFSLTTYTLVIH